MDNTELISILRARLADVETRIVAACQRAGRLRQHVTLIAVTKTVSPQVATLLLELGVHDLGESRPQELWKKADAIAGVRWHLIGHLQRNKLDKTIPLVSLVHSVDSVRLLEALDAFGTKYGTPVRVLLEVNCSREEAKGGFHPDEVPALGDKAMSLPGVQLDGLMTMAAHHDDPQRCRPTFIELGNLRDQLRRDTGLSLPHLSMGMSNDFEVAVEHGATFVRLGSTLFEGLT